MKPKSSILPALIALTASASLALAADLTWDTSGAAGILGGTGNWDTTLTNWTTTGGASNIAWNNTTNAADAALFTTGTGRVTLTTDIYLAKLQISSTNSSTIGGRSGTNYVFDGPGSLQFGTQQGVIDNTASGLATQVGANLVGTGGLVIKAAGAGTGLAWLTLNGNNSGLSGGIRIDSGVLAVATPGALGANTITLNGGGIFGPVDRSGPASSTLTGPTNLTLANNIVVNNVAGNLIRVWGSRNLFLTGSVTGGGGFDKSDNGAAFIRSSSITSAITVSGGALWLNQLNNGGTINIGGATTLGYLGSSETTDRVVNFTSSSGGNITAHGNLTLTSNITGAASAMGVTFNGGGAASMNGFSTGALINFNKQGLGIWTVNGQLNLVGGALRAQGGVLAMSATSSTVTNANIERANNGVIRFASGSSIKTASTNTNNILGGWATFDNNTWAKTNGSGVAIDGLATFANDTWAAGNNTTVTAAGANPSSDSTTNSLRFDAAGAKTLTLAGINTLTSGGLMVTANVGANTTTITGGTLRGANTTDLVIHQFNTDGSLTIGSVISNNTGATGITKTGAGSVLLSGANDYTGTTRVFEGTLRVTGNSGAKIYEVGSQGRLEIGYTIGTGTYGYGVTVNGNGVSSTNGVYFDGGRNYNLQSTLRLAGAPTTVRQYGTGAAILYGYDISGTHLAVENTASGSVIGTNIDFQPNTYGYQMNIAPGLNTATGDLIVQGVFAGGTNVDNTHYRKVGFGSLRIEGAGTATTPFQIRQGSVILAGGANRLGSGSSMRLGEGGDSGLLVLEGVNQTFTSLTNSGTGTDNRVSGGSATLSTLTINNATASTLAAALGGSGPNQNNLALTKSGAGVLTLNGTNSYSGPTTVTLGTLQLARQSALYNNTPANWTASNIVVQSGATLALNVGGAGEFTATDLDTLKTLGSATGGFLTGARLGIDTTNAVGNFTYAGGIANPNGGANALGLTKLGSGTLVISGSNNTYTGLTQVLGGKLTVDTNSGAKGYEIGTSGTLELGYSNSASAYDFGVTVNGAGVSATTGLYLKGGNTYSFMRNNGGTLRLAVAPTTVRQYGTGAAILTGFDTNFTQLTVENTASGSVIGTNIEFQPGLYGYVMNIASGANTATGDLMVQGVFAGGTNGNGTHFRKVGSGSLRIEGAGTATTPFEVRQGSVILAGGANRLGSGSSMRLGEGVDSGLLVLEGVNQTFTSLTNSGTGTNNRVVGGSATLSTLTINNGTASTLAAILGGSGLNQNNLALTKTGVGVLTLSGINTHSGGTTVNGGTLVLATAGELSNAAGVTIGGTNASSTPTLAGGGTIRGATVIALAGGGAAGTHAPGVTGVSNGVGTQTFTNTLNYQTGSIFEWDLRAISTTDPGAAASDAATGTYDQVVASGSSGSVTGSAAVFKVVLGGNAFTDAFWDTNKSWSNIFSGTGSPSNLASIFTSFSNTGGLSAGDGTVAEQGQFTFTGSTLNWTAVPEPTSALAGLLIGAGLLRRRRA